jgi:pyruvate,orthophosphate dikinase
VTKGRAANPQLELGVCGEHGGDPASIATFERIGLDYVSCSPFRVPVARLAAAHAVLAARTSATPRLAAAQPKRAARERKPRGNRAVS